MIWHIGGAVVGAALAAADTPAAGPDASAGTNGPPSAAVILSAPAVPLPTGPVEPPTNFWFEVGEELTYRVYWGWIAVGKTRVVTEWVREGDRTLLAIRYRTRSNSVLSKIYPVDDRIEAVIDPDGFRPVRFVKDLKEGRRKVHEITTFDFAKLEAHWISLSRNREKTYPISPGSRDLVTFMFHLRRHEFVPGRREQFEVMADDKLYELFLDVHAYERVALPVFGKVPSVRVEPSAKFQGLFVRKGKMLVWVSRDPRRIVTRMEAEVPFANVKAVVCEVRGPGDDFWTRKTREADPDDYRDDEEVERALRDTAPREP